MQGEPLAILLVENNPDLAELILRNLQDHPIANRVYHVSDGEAALDYLLRRGAYADPAMSSRPCMVLLDLRLPRIDGLEVLQRINGSDCAHWKTPLQNHLGIDREPQTAQDREVFVIDEGGQVVAHRNPSVILKNTHFDLQYWDRVFNLFEQLDPSVEGSGVGLAIVRRIVETNGGIIWFESEGLGKGSTFCLAYLTSKSYMRKGIRNEE